MATAPVNLTDDPSRTNLRFSARHEPVFRDARLTWKVEPGDAVEVDDDPDATGEFHAWSLEPKSQDLFALLLDISTSGARVVVDRLPSNERSVWFRLDGRHSASWSEAHVVGATVTPRGPHVLRLAFRSPCPFDTLRDAICG